MAAPLAALAAMTGDDALPIRFKGKFDRAAKAAAVKNR